MSNLLWEAVDLGNCRKRENLKKWLGEVQRSFGPREQRSPKSLLHHPKPLLHRCNPISHQCKRVFACWPRGPVASFHNHILKISLVGQFPRSVLDVEFPGLFLPNPPTITSINHRESAINTKTASINVFLFSPPPPFSVKILTVPPSDWHPQYGPCGSVRQKRAREFNTYSVASQNIL